MSKDKTFIWILQYLFGFVLITAVVPAAIYAQPKWTDAHVWASELFAVGLGVVLVSCGSSMRQRMTMSKRIDDLAEQIKAKQQ